MIETYKAVAVAAARKAGVLLMENFGKLSREEINSKMRFDFVTKIDTTSEELIVEMIRAAFPDHTFLGEETHRDEGGEYRWIIDPLDGTTNYIHALPIFSVSIALQIRGKMALGVVYDPTRDELFYGEKGGGAYLNAHPIHVSTIENPETALLATGFPFRVKHLFELYQQSFNRLFLQVSGIRRAGSAALDLCYVACGRFDGFWELDLKPWDIAAASVILSEAGGLLTDFAGGGDVLRTGNTVASNTMLHPMMMETIRDVFAGQIDR
jgi:myo-inositol-1(or 4)-monophosphatase